MTGGLLRRRDGHHARVGFVELFFDLVFVFAITQISHTLLAHLTWLGALQAAIMLGAVWWVWIDTSWITNWLDPERPLVRVMLFGLMGAGLVLSTSLPEAFGEKGLVFAIAFASLQIGRGLFTLWAVRGDPVQRANFQRIVIWASVGGAIWISGGLADGQTRLLLWLLALSLEFLGPMTAFWCPGLGHSRATEWNVEGAHLAERVGLFVIICLGESIIITGATFAELPWTATTVLAFVSAFLGTVAMWWLFFSAKHDAASEVIARAENAGAIARAAYTYAPLPVVAGIVVTAVGDEMVLMHPSGHMEAAAIWVLVGGPALFLAGTAVAIFAVWGHWPRSRLVGLAALGALAAAAPLLTPLLLTAASTVVLMAVGAWETLVPSHKRPG
ncbi:low temperature requirement protein A [Brevundimonas sp.]|jgi:low temperature requirement protein LtrA|uniref:low temperature requirement protein A n=1 Tax=Brevundimonas sp. TaxID=1871086 RepID=UPI0025C328A4|nr:low temperature requirement protein A [Brevundimonas sp.]